MPNAGNVVMLFTASKIGVPGPRIGFMVAPGEVELVDGSPKPFSDLALKVMADDALFLDPLTAEGFAGYLTRDGKPLDRMDFCRVV
jgi:hypothetical protein